MRDLRYALRNLLRSPGFTLTAVATLALGIGANTAIFSMVYAILLRPLPYPEPERLVEIPIVATNTRTAQPSRFPWSYPRFQDLERFQQSFQHVAAYAPLDVNLTGTDNPERLAGEVVTAGYFDVLGVAAARGHVFAAGENHPVVLLGDGLWRSRYGSDPGVIGRTIRLNDLPFTVAGILPRDFKGLSGKTGLWMPMHTVPLLTDNPRRLTNAMSYWHQVIARLKPGTSLEQARDQMRAVERQIEEAHPGPRNMRFSLQVTPLLESKIDPAVRKALLVLFGAVGFVLLIACGNLANLLLGRAASRRSEVGIRLALGAGRGTLIRQFLTESTILGLLGGAAALLVALWAADVMDALRPQGGLGFWGRYARTVGPEALRLNAPVVAFNFLLALATGVLFGLVPALRASATDITGSLKGVASWSSRPHRRLWNTRNGLVVSEMAMALVLLAGAGLMVQTLVALLRVPLGFDGSRVLTLTLELPRKQYTGAAAQAFYARLLERLAPLPGLEASALASAVPVSGQTAASVVEIEGRPEGHPVGVHLVSSGFLTVLKIPLRRGRWFTPQDDQQAPKVAAINEAAARNWFPDEDPVGKRVSTAGWGQPGELAEIVGVVGDVKYEAVEAAVEPDLYIPAAQQAGNSAFLLVRGVGDPRALIGAIREQVLALDKDLPVYGVTTMDERVAGVTSRARFSTMLLTAFSSLALILAAVGIYGVVSYSVSARTREIGVRMALGARAREVLGMVVKENLALCFAGLAIGLPAAWAATRLLSGFLFGVAPGDPVTLAGVSALLLMVVLLASFLPARRASRVDPMVALRYE